MPMNCDAPLRAGWAGRRDGSFGSLALPEEGAPSPALQLLLPSSAGEAARDVAEVMFLPPPSLQLVTSEKEEQLCEEWQTQALALPASLQTQAPCPNPSDTQHRERAGTQNVQIVFLRDQQQPSLSKVTAPRVSFFINKPTLQPTLLASPWPAELRPIRSCTNTPREATFHHPLLSLVTPPAQGKGPAVQHHPAKFYSMLQQMTAHSWLSGPQSTSTTREPAAIC